MSGELVPYPSKLLVGSGCLHASGYSLNIDIMGGEWLRVVVSAPGTFTLIKSVLRATNSGGLVGVGLML